MLATMPEFETLKEAKEHLRANWGRGVTCPCCGRYVKLYKRNMNAGIVINLFQFYHYDRQHPGEYLHAYELMKSKSDHFNMEYAKLGYWGLIEKKPHTPDEKKSSGYWRITEKGRQFAVAGTTMPAKVHIYDDHIVGYSAEQVTIQQALGIKFDYQELMGVSRPAPTLF